MRPWRDPARRLRQRWRHALVHSIQGRLVALFVLLALATSAVFLYGMQRVVQNGWQAYAKPLVADYVDRLAAEIGSPPSIDRARALTRSLPLTVRIHGPLVDWDSRDESSPPVRLRPRHGEEADAENGIDHSRAAAWGLVRHTADGHRITFGLAQAPDEARPRLIGWVTLCGLLVLTALAYLTVRRLLAPLRPIAAGVAAYGRGEFGHPIAVQRRDELGFLAARINAMAASLRAMLDAKRALLLAISHELRSPLTRARVHVELLDDSPNRDALLRDLGEMRELVASLLESERLTQGHAALHAEPTDLAELVRELLASQFADADLALELDGSIGRVNADPTRLRLMLRNLVTNALRHGAQAAARPVVFLKREADGRIALGVRDHGPGVGVEQLALLGQAFYRPDSARSRGIGGVGLGLYLCRLVAQAHGGELRIRNAEPGLEVNALWRAASA